MTASVDFLARLLHYANGGSTGVTLIWASHPPGTEGRLLSPSEVPAPKVGGPTDGPDPPAVVLPAETGLEPQVPRGLAGLSDGDKLQLGQIRRPADIL
jgi:hypothetical protein